MGYTIATGSYALRNGKRVNEIEVNHPFVGYSNKILPMSAFYYI